MKRFLVWLVRATHDKPWRTVALAVAVAAIATALSAQLGFRGDFTELLPDSAPEVKDLKEIEGRAGGTGYLIVQVLGGTAEDRRAFANEAAPAIESRRDVVRFVEYHFDTEFLRQRALLLMDTELLTSLRKDVEARIAWEKKSANPLYVDLGEEEPPPDFSALEAKYGAGAPKSDFIESKNGEELYLLVKPTSTPADLEYNRRLIAAVGEAIATVAPRFPNLKAHFTGAYVIRVEEDDVMQADLARSVIIATILTLAIILLVSRRLAIVPAVVLPVGIGISTTFAFASIKIGHLNPVTGFLGAVLIGLGIEYGLHLAMRYWEERETHAPLAAMQETILSTFGGALSSAVTNAAAFFVVTFAEFEAFKQFGMMAALGVLATLVATYAFGPAVLFLSEKMAWRKPTLLRSAAAKKTAFRPSTRLLLSLAVAICLATAVSLVLSPRIGFETNLLKLKGEAPAAELENHVAEQMGIIMVPAIAWVRDLDAAKTVSGIAEELQNSRGPDSPLIQVASLNDLLPTDADRRLAEMAKLEKLLSTLPTSLRSDARVERFRAMTTAKPWTIDELPAEFRRRFEPFDHQGTFVLLFPRFTLHDVTRLDNWARELMTITQRAEAVGIHAPILDASRIAAKIFSLIKKDGPRIMGLAALVVFLTIWIALKRLPAALLVTGPLFMGMACLPAGMLLFDVSFNFLNVVVLPNLLAVAVDNSVHLYHRYSEDGPGSLPRIMRSTGITTIVATCSNATGYGTLLVARHAGLRSVGLLAIIGVACTFVGTTILFPSLVELWERFRRRQLSPAPPAPGVP